ncbi:MAG: hypothetical protein ACK559_01590, partial [bacterium]
MVAAYSNDHVWFSDSAFRRKLFQKLAEIGLDLLGTAPIVFRTTANRVHHIAPIPGQQFHSLGQLG